MVERLTNKSGNLIHQFVHGDKADWAIILAKLWNGNFHVVFFNKDLSKRRDMEVRPEDLPHTPNYLIKELALSTAKTKGPILGDTVYGKPLGILLKRTPMERLTKEREAEEEEEETTLAEDIRQLAGGV